jgi:hypothetical protein
MCPVCGGRGAELGVLCVECSDELALPVRIAPEQIQARGSATTDAVLVDRWGRPHRLAAHARIGRHPDGDGVAVLEPSLSRHHAELRFDGAAWTLHDLGSVNGSYIDDHLVEGHARLGACVPVRFGQVPFYFIARLVAERQPLAVAMATTRLPRLGDAPPQQGYEDEFREEPTDPGLPSVVLRMHQPTGGGGGLVEIEDAQLQLTTTQFEMMELMVERMQGEAEQPPLVRGFVRSAELIRRLSWDTKEPNDNHVKQLVRRMRRSLVRSGVGDLIESRHRMGYRLRATPRP